MLFHLAAFFCCFFSTTALERGLVEYMHFDGLNPKLLLLSSPDLHVIINVLTILIFTDCKSRFDSAETDCYRVEKDSLEFRLVGFSA